jgi:hypothetical protein
MAGFQISFKKMIQDFFGFPNDPGNQMDPVAPQQAGRVSIDSAANEGLDAQRPDSFQPFPKAQGLKGMVLAIDYRSVFHRHHEDLGGAIKSRGNPRAENGDGNLHKNLDSCTARDVPGVRQRSTAKNIKSDIRLLGLRWLFRGHPNYFICCFIIEMLY